jgi:heptosyltransferase III
MRVVVFHQGALGDFLLTVPVLESLHQFYPEIRIDFWSKREHVSLLEGKNYLGGFHTLEGRLLPGLLQDSLRMTSGLPDFLMEADQVFIFGQAGTRVLAERLSTLLRAKVDWVQSFPIGDESRIHVTDFVCRQISRLGWNIGKRFGGLAPNPKELDSVTALLQDFEISSPPILIHPGSGGKRKIWPLKNWRDLVMWIKNALHIPVLLSLGPADEYLGSFAGTMLQAGIPTVSGLPLTRLAALLSRCRLYAGSDSGISHLAAGLGIQTVAVFGPTDPAVWGPRGEKVRVLRKDWRESEILEWDASRPAETPDGEVARIITGMLSPI